MDFNDINFHDSDVISLKLVNDVRGMDKLEILMDYIVSYESPSITERRLLVFERCWRVVLDYNCGIVAPESILGAEILLNSDLLLNQKNIFKKRKTEFPSRIQHYRIKLNTSASCIDVLAEKYVFQSPVNDRSRVHDAPDE